MMRLLTGKITQAELQEKALENNHSRSVDDPVIREKILKIVRDWIA